MSRRIKALTVKSMLQEPGIAASENPRIKTQCTESSEHSQRCLNPLCNGLVEPKKHAPVKRYCSPDCTQTASIIRKAGKLLEALSTRERFKF
jgi:hypothetical protein